MTRRLEMYTIVDLSQVWRRARSLLLAVIAGWVVLGVGHAQLVQQGPKLVGTGAVGMNAGQGSSVALSADGNTALVGGSGDNGGAGAAWVFIRYGGVWSQQAKLVGTGAAGLYAQQGLSVALSADGNTALVGGAGDNGNAGAAWVFTRSGSTWTQQGTKLVGSGAAGLATQGSSVALSADGNTAAVGGPRDGLDGTDGAVWIWTRSGSTWTQQGSKLADTTVATWDQGSSVALSGDGNTLLVGGPGYTGNAPDVGAAWVWTRSGGTWTQQGPKLVGSGIVGTEAFQGGAVALSGDGNTAAVGGRADNGGLGAVWVWTRSGSTWSQQGPKLVGSGGVASNGAVWQGSSLALSSDGNTALIGGRSDSSNTGAVWRWTRSGGTWTQQGNGNMVGSGAGLAAQQGFSVALTGNASTAIWGGPGDNPNGAAWVFILPTRGDFDGDGVPDVALQFPDGSMGFWTLGETAGQFPILGFNFLSGPLPDPTEITLVNVADLDGDGTQDLILRFKDGSTGVWYRGGPLGTTITGFAFISGPIQGWVPAAMADINLDFHLDMLIQNSNGPNADGSMGVWYLGEGAGNLITGFFPISGPIAGWKLVGAADRNAFPNLNSTGKPEVFIQYKDGSVGVWYLTGGFSPSQPVTGFALIAGPSPWQVVGVVDMNGDGVPDLLIRNKNDGTLGVWYLGGMGGNQITGFAQITTPGGLTWLMLGPH